MIETKSTRGKGTSADPKREVTQYWDFDGNLITEKEKIVGAYQKTLSVGELPLQTSSFL